MAQDISEPASDDAEPAIIAPPEPPVTAPPPPAKPSGLWPLLGGVVAAVIGFGAAQVVPAGWPLGAGGAVEQDVAAIKAQLADTTLTEQVAALKTSVDAMPVQTDLAPVLDRLSQLEARLSALETAPATGSTTALAADVAALKSTLATMGPGQAPSDALVKQASDAIAAQLAATETRIADLNAATTAIATRAAVRQIQAAIDSGSPYTSALADLKTASLDAVLTDNAATGFPTLAQVQASFPDAARAALEASLRANMGESWSDRVANFLRNQTGARSLTPREGNDPDAILSRAEAALTAADLPTALQEIAALPPEGVAALADWQAGCERRQAGIAAVAALAQTLGE